MICLTQVYLSLIILCLYYPCVSTFDFSRNALKSFQRKIVPGATVQFRFLRNRLSSFLLRSSKDWTQLSENNMLIDEIRSELELRGIDYRDFISRKELVEKLVEARATGKADPKILDNFNQQISTADVIDVNSLDSEEFEQVKASDGGLPGGLNPEAIKALVSNPKIIKLLQDPKMQEMMRTVMTGGQDAFKKRFVSDPDARILIETLNEAIAGTLSNKK